MYIICQVKSYTQLLINFLFNMMKVITYQILLYKVESMSENQVPVIANKTELSDDESDPDFVFTAPPGVYETIEDVGQMTLPFAWG